MAQGPMSASEFTDHVRVIEAAFSDLPDLVAEWKMLHAADQATAEYEWSEALARLNRLANAAQRGLLDSPQFHTASTLQRRLAASLSLTRSIGLHDPRA